MNHLARPPLAIDLELVRAAETASPHGVATGEWNRYLLRDPDDSGRYEDGDFVWDESMQADLSATGDAASAGEAVKRLGAAMRAFIESAGWARIAARIQEARAAGRAVCLTVRSAAQELYTLPWELLDVGGAPVYQTDDCLLRYQRPGAGEPAAAPPAPSERVLVAWSGAVPAADHIDAIAAAASAGHVRFDRERDVLAHASVASIDKALRERPAAILHLLCHGQAIAGGQAYGLRLDGATGPAPPAAVRDLLAPHRHGLRLVVLAACLGSSAGAADNALGSVAQAIIEAGVPAVVASRYPLSTSGSTLLTRVLYQRLLVDLWSLARAFLDARAALRGEASEVRGLDAVAVQLHTGRTRSLDFWPWIIRPYRGLRAYDREDARLFFGREAERALLRGRMEAVLERGGPRFLLVAGASGTGKSSLVRAGLLADLQAATPSWSTEVMRPGEGAAPIERLARCLERHRGATARLALVVDQLEELFTEVSAPGQREAFLRELWRLACDPAAGVFVIATIRIEYLGHLGNVRRDDDGVGFDRELLDGDCLYIVRQLGPEQYARIIRGPAQAAGVLIEPGLLARLLHELRAQPGALPLLSYTLDHLWERRGFATQEIAWRHVTGQPDAAAAREDARVTGWWLTDAAYDAPGGIEGELAGSADAVYAQLGPDHQAELRRVLVQLVQGHEDVLLATRRRGWRQALRPGPETAVIFDQVVDMLVDARLLVQGSDGGPDDPVWIELAHDALIRFWPGLHRWYQEARAWLGQAEELRELAEDWRPHARGDDSPAAREREDPYLGLRGQRLSYHLEAWSHYRHHLGAEAQRLGQAFLDACVRAEAERIEAERARERAARRRTRVTAMVAVAVAAVMAVLGLWARGQQLVAEEQRSAADRGRSEAQAQRVEAEKQRAIAVEREAAARDASIMAGARALMARNQPAWATRLLEELPRPLDVHGWRVLAFEALSQTRLIVTLRGHEDAIHDLALSPDGELVATASSDGTARVWRADGAGAPLVCRHEGEVKAVDFSPDGELLVTASDDRTARLWRVDDAAQIAVLRAHDVAVLVAKFSPDGERVITGARDGTVRLWRVDDPGQSTALTGHRGPVMTADFSPDGKLAVTGSGDGTARIWRVDEPGSSVLLSGHERTIRSVSFSPAGRHVITASLDKTVRIWFVSDPTKFTIVERHTEMAWFAAFSPVGPRYMTAFSDGTVHLWDAGSETPVALAGHEGSVSAAAFSPDGERLVTASADGTARIWRTGEPDGFFTTLGDDAFRRERTISSAGFSADGTLVFSLASDGLAQVWRTDGSGQVATLGAPERRISAADLGPEGERVATVSSDGELRLWGVKDGREIAATHAHEDPIRSVRFSPDGTLVVTASRDGTARIWRPHGRGAEIEPIATLRGHEKALTSAAFSPDGALVITTSHDGAARIWRVADPAQVMVLRGPPGDNFGQIDSAAFSPDGKLVATNSARETCVWRIDEPGGARVLRRYPASDTPAQLSPDGLHVLTSMGDLAQVRRLQASDQAIILRGHSDRIISASFSPDGELVFTASRDGTARIWSVDAPEQPVVLEDGGTVHEAPFSPDGDLVLGHWRGRARIVPIGVEGLRAGLHRANQDCLGPRMRQRYLGEIEGDARHGYEDCELAYGRVPLDTRTSNAGGQP
ncbi:MAG TPA: CHAT domain-containing protein [Haliangium sp.]|nr:CHAT domain-containing protein [Haliangium sp.]